MTEEEILEAQKLIASMRDDLSLIAGSSNDADRLREKITPLFARTHKLTSLLSQEEAQRIGAEISRTIMEFYDETVVHIFRPGLAETVTTRTSVILSALDKIEQALAQELKQPPNPKAGG
jgi:hypothetical protein